MGTIKKRYYIHGDLYEDDPDLYYCAEHDLFVHEEHFSEPHREGHMARHQYASKHIDRHMKNSKEYFRPMSPENIFA